MNKITVVTTSYNDSKNISKYLDSMCSQSVSPFEIIIADGGSKDNTLSIIEAYKRKTAIPIRVVQKGRLNIAQGFNLGIKYAQTQLVCLTCIGNTFPNDMLETLFHSFFETKCDACYGKMAGINNGKISKLYNKCFLGGETGIPVMSNRCVLYDKRVFDKIGFFLEHFLYAGEDAEFLQAFKKKGMKANFVPKVVVYWETPNSWNEYLKKLKFYSIAELQYSAIMKQYINKDLALLFIFIASLILGGMGKVFIIIIPLACFATLILYTSISKKLSLNESLFCLSRRYIKLFYKIKYVKYCFPKFRVQRCN